MKTLIALAALVLLPLTSNAMSPVRPVELNSVTPIVKMTVGSGFVPSGVVSRQITLGEDGNVSLVEYSRDMESRTESKETTDSLWYFEPDVMDKVAAAVSKIKSAKLVDTNAKEPLLLDGPSTSLQVYQSGRFVTIASIHGGHLSLPADRNEARAARYLLGNMQNLYKAILSN